MCVFWVFFCDSLLESGALYKSNFLVIPKQLNELESTLSVTSEGELEFGFNL